MPEIDDQHNPGFTAIVPSLVLEAIVKDIGLALLLLPYLITHPHTTILDSRKRKMKSQFFICGAVVLHDVGVGGERADETMVVIIGYVRVDHPHGERQLLTVDVEFHIVQLQIEHVPHATVDRLVSHSVLRLTLRYPRRTAVRLEPLLTPKTQDLFTNLEIVVLEVLQPRKLLSPPKFNHPYHHGLALSRGMISGQPFCREEEGGMQVWLILASSHGRMRSTLLLFLSPRCTLMNLDTAICCRPLRKQSLQKAPNRYFNFFSISSYPEKSQPYVSIII